MHAASTHVGHQVRARDYGQTGRLRGFSCFSCRSLSTKSPEEGFCHLQSLYADKAVSGCLELDEGWSAPVGMEPGSAARTTPGGLPSRSTTTASPGTQDRLTIPVHSRTGRDCYGKPPSLKFTMAPGIRRYPQFPTAVTVYLKPNHVLTGHFWNSLALRGHRNSVFDRM
jgi:hypothetical protein